MRRLATALWVFLNLWMAIAAFQLDLASNGFAAYAIFLVMLFVATLCHEAGHAIAARLKGATVQTFAALFFEYDLERRKFSAMRRRIGNYEIGGFVAYTWPPGADSLRKDAMIAAAGPLANLVAAALAVAMVPLFAPQPAPSEAIEAATANGSNSDIIARLPPANMLTDAAVNQALARADAEERRAAVRRFIEAALQVFALLSVGIAVINLIPFNGSDGATLLRMLRSR